MSARALLLQSLLGHLALLEAKHPRKAAAPVVRRIKRCLGVTKIARRKAA